MVCGADGGVGWPDAVVAVAVTSYVVPGARPVSLQSYGTLHVTVMGVPPPMGVAVRVYGPVTPLDVGETSTLRDEGPTSVTSIAGAPEPGVTTVNAGDAGVGLPVVASVPTAVTEYVVPGLSPVSVQYGVAHVTVMGVPPPTGTAVRV